MTTIVHYIGVWADGDLPSTQEVKDGTRAIDHQTTSTVKGNVVPYSVTGLAAGTDYGLECVIVNTEAEEDRAPRLAFSTVKVSPPIAPADTNFTGYNGNTYNNDISDLWTNADPTGFTATGLPPGITMTTGGVLSGTYTTNGSYNTEITNTNSDGSDTWYITWQVIDAPIVPEGAGAGLQLMLQLRI